MMLAHIPKTLVATVALGNHHRWLTWAATVVLGNIDHLDHMWLPWADTAAALGLAVVVVPALPRLLCHLAAVVAALVFLFVVG